MDDTNQKQNTAVKSNDQGQVVQPTQQGNPIGGTKEAPVVPSTEWVAPSNPEIVLPQEVKDAGVEVKPVAPPIAEDAQKAGVRMAHSQMEIHAASTDTLNLQTPRSVLKQLQDVHKKASDAIAWLINLIIKEQDKKERGTIE